MVLAVPLGTACAGLIVNGNFESGNTGFTTQYTYTTDLTKPRTIVVGVDPRFYNPRAVSYRDHTYGFGSMLIANGAEDTDITVWEQTVSVTPNTQYVFCYWLSSWCDTDTRLAEIKCFINDGYVGLGFAPEVAGEWTLIFHRWNSGVSSQATIRLVDRDRADVGNDFAIDDIDLIDIGDKQLLVTYTTKGGRVVTPGQGVFLYPEGDTVELEAKCDSGYEFVSWAGNFFDLSPRMSVAMNNDYVAVAKFKKLDYSVTMQASGSAPNEFSTCDEAADRLATFHGALDSLLYPSGLIVGERKGLCEATYRFPILKPKGGMQGITKIVVSTYGTVVSGNTIVKVDDAPAGRFEGDLHQTFTGKAVADMLGRCEGPICWLPVRVAGYSGTCDLADVYLSYDCPGIPTPLLRRFHDHLSIYQALEGYAQAPDIRDLYSLKANQKSAWESVVQTSGLAQDLAGYSDTLPGVLGTFIEDLDETLAHWQSLADIFDATILKGCNCETILTCLDEAVLSGQSYIAAYADAIADGRVVADEAAQLNRSMADWKADLAALNTAMTEVFRTLGDVHYNAASRQLRDAAERMIRAMAPWRTGEPDDFGLWVASSPTYLEQVIQALQDFPAEDILIP
jgi:hypothetical protein